MNRTLSTLTIAAATVALSAFPAAGQAVPDDARFGFDLHATGGIATQDDARDSSEAGFGFGATLHLRLMPHLFVYGGWDWMGYQAIEEIAGPDVDLEETGYAAGLRWEHPLGASGITYWVRGGALIHHFELEDDAGDLLDDTGHGVGWEAAAGMGFSLGSGWSLTPGVRYRSVTREAEIDATAIDIELQAVTFELGFRRFF